MARRRHTRGSSSRRRQDGGGSSRRRHEGPDFSRAPKTSLNKAKIPKNSGNMPKESQDNKPKTAAGKSRITSSTKSHNRLSPQGVVHVKSYMKGVWKKFGELNQAAPVARQTQAEPTQVKDPKDISVPKDSPTSDVVMSTVDKWINISNGGNANRHMLETLARLNQSSDKAGVESNVRHLSSMLLGVAHRLEASGNTGLATWVVSRSRKLDVDAAQILRVGDAPHQIDVSKDIINKNMEELLAGLMVHDNVLSLNSFIGSKVLRDQTALRDYVAIANAAGHIEVVHSIERLLMASEGDSILHQKEALADLIGELSNKGLSGLVGQASAISLTNPTHLINGLTNLIHNHDEIINIRRENMDLDNEYGEGAWADYHDQQGERSTSRTQDASVGGAVSSLNSLDKSISELSASKTMTQASLENGLVYNLANLMAQGEIRRATSDRADGDSRNSDEAAANIKAENRIADVVHGMLVDVSLSNVAERLPLLMWAHKVSQEDPSLKSAKRELAKMKPALTQAEYQKYQNALQWAHGATAELHKLLDGTGVKLDDIITYTTARNDISGLTMGRTTELFTKQIMPHLVSKFSEQVKTALDTLIYQMVELKSSEGAAYGEINAAMREFSKNLPSTFSQKLKDNSGYFLLAEMMPVSSHSVDRRFMRSATASLNNAMRAEALEGHTASDSVGAADLALGNTAGYRSLFLNGDGFGHTKGSELGYTMDNGDRAEHALDTLRDMINNVRDLSESSWDSSSRLKDSLEDIIRNHYTVIRFDRAQPVDMDTSASLENVRQKAESNQLLLQSFAKETLAHMETLSSVDSSLGKTFLRNVLTRLKSIDTVDHIDALGDSNSVRNMLAKHQNNIKWMRDQLGMLEQSPSIYSESLISSYKNLMWSVTRLGDMSNTYDNRLKGTRELINDAIASADLSKVDQAHIETKIKEAADNDIYVLNVLGDAEGISAHLKAQPELHLIDKDSPVAELLKETYGLRQHQIDKILSDLLSTQTKWAEDNSAALINERSSSDYILLTQYEIPDATNTFLMSRGLEKEIVSRGILSPGISRYIKTHYKGRSLVGTAFDKEIVSSIAVERFLQGVDAAVLTGQLKQDQSGIRLREQLVDAIMQGEEETASGLRNELMLLFDKFRKESPSKLAESLKLISPEILNEFSPSKSSMLVKSLSSAALNRLVTRATDAEFNAVAPTSPSKVALRTPANLERAADLAQREADTAAANEFLSKNPEMNSLLESWGHTEVEDKMRTLLSTFKAIKFFDRSPIYKEAMYTANSAWQSLSRRAAGDDVLVHQSEMATWVNRGYAVDKGWANNDNKKAYLDAIGFKGTALVPSDKLGVSTPWSTDKNLARVQKMMADLTKLDLMTQEVHSRFEDADVSAAEDALAVAYEEINAYLSILNGPDAHVHTAFVQRENGIMALVDGAELTPSDRVYSGTNGLPRNDGRLNGALKRREYGLRQSLMRASAELNKVVNFAHEKAIKGEFDVYSAFATSDSPLSAPKDMTGVGHLVQAARQAILHRQRSLNTWGGRNKSDNTVDRQVALAYGIRNSLRWLTKESPIVDVLVDADREAKNNEINESHYWQDELSANLAMGRDHEVLQSLLQIGGGDFDKLAHTMLSQSQMRDIVASSNYLSKLLKVGQDRDFKHDTLSKVNRSVVGPMHEVTSVELRKGLEQLLSLKDEMGSIDMDALETFTPVSSEVKRLIKDALVATDSHDLYLSLSGDERDLLQSVHTAVTKKKIGKPLINNADVLSAFGLTKEQADKVVQDDTNADQELLREVQDMDDLIHDMLKEAGFTPDEIGQVVSGGDALSRSAKNKLDAMMAGQRLSDKVLDRVIADEDFKTLTEQELTGLDAEGNPLQTNSDGLSPRIVLANSLTQQRLVDSTSYDQNMSPDMRIDSIRLELNKSDSLFDAATKIIDNGLEASDNSFLSDQDRHEFLAALSHEVESRIASLTLTDPNSPSKRDNNKLNKFMDELAPLTGLLRNLAVSKGALQSKIRSESIKQDSVQAKLAQARAEGQTDRLTADELSAITGLPTAPRYLSFDIETIGPLGSAQRELMSKYDSPHEYRLAGHDEIVTITAFDSNDDRMHYYVKEVKDTEGNILISADEMAQRLFTPEQLAEGHKIEPLDAFGKLIADTHTEGGVLLAHNGDAFDVPVLKGNGIDVPVGMPTIDTMTMIGDRKGTDYVALDNVSQASLSRGKTDKGSSVGNAWNKIVDPKTPNEVRQQVMHDLLVYNAEDSALARDVYFDAQQTGITLVHDVDGTKAVQDTEVKMVWNPTTQTMEKKTVSKMVQEKQLGAIRERGIDLSYILPERPNTEPLAQAQSLMTDFVTQVRRLHRIDTSMRDINSYTYKSTAENLLNSMQSLGIESGVVDRLNREKSDSTNAIGKKEVYIVTPTPSEAASVGPGGDAQPGQTNRRYDERDLGNVWRKVVTDYYEMMGRSKPPAELLNASHIDRSLVQRMKNATEQKIQEVNARDDRLNVIDRVYDELTPEQRQLVEQIANDPELNTPELAKALLETPIDTMLDTIAASINKDPAELSSNEVTAEWLVNNKDVVKAIIDTTGSSFGNKLDADPSLHSELNQILHGDKDNMSSKLSELLASSPLKETTHALMDQGSQINNLGNDGRRILVEFAVGSLTRKDAEAQLNQLSAERAPSLAVAMQLANSLKGDFSHQISNLSTTFKSGASAYQIAGILMAHGLTASGRAQYAPAVSTALQHMDWGTALMESVDAMHAHPESLSGTVQEGLALIEKTQFKDNAPNASEAKEANSMEPDSKEATPLLERLHSILMMTKDKGHIAGLEVNKSNDTDGVLGDADAGSPEFAAELSKQMLDRLLGIEKRVESGSDKLIDHSAEIDQALDHLGTNATVVKVHNGDDLSLVAQNMVDRFTGDNFNAIKKTSNDRYSIIQLHDRNSDAVHTLVVHNVEVGDPRYIDSRYLTESVWDTYQRVKVRSGEADPGAHVVGHEDEMSGTSDSIDRYDVNISAKEVDFQGEDRARLDRHASEGKLNTQSAPEKVLKAGQFKPDSNELAQIMDRVRSKTGIYKKKDGGSQTVGDVERFVKDMFNMKDDTPVTREQAETMLAIRQMHGHEKVKLSAIDGMISDARSIITKIYEKVDSRVRELPQGNTDFSSWNAADAYKLHFDVAKDTALQGLVKESYTLLNKLHEMKTTAQYEFGTTAVGDTPILLMAEAISQSLSSITKSVDARHIAQKILGEEVSGKESIRVMDEVRNSIRDNVAGKYSKHALSSFNLREDAPREFFEDPNTYNPVALENLIKKTESTVVHLLETNTGIIGSNIRADVTRLVDQLVGDMPMLLDSAEASLQHMYKYARADQAHLDSTDLAMSVNFASRVGRLASNISPEFVRLNPYQRTESIHRTNKEDDTEYLLTDTLDATKYNQEQEAVNNALDEEVSIRARAIPIPFNQQVHREALSQKLATGNIYSISQHISQLLLSTPVDRYDTSGTAQKTGSRVSQMVAKKIPLGAQMASAKRVIARAEQAGTAEGLAISKILREQLASRGVLEQNMTPQLPKDAETNMRALDKFRRETEDSPWNTFVDSVLEARIADHLDLPSQQQREMQVELLASSEIRTGADKEANYFRDIISSYEENYGQRMKEALNNPELSGELSVYNWARRKKEELTGTPEVEDYFRTTERPQAPTDKYEGTATFYSKLNAEASKWDGKSVDESYWAKRKLEAISGVGSPMDMKGIEIRRHEEILAKSPSKDKVGESRAILKELTGVEYPQDYRQQFVENAVKVAPNDSESMQFYDPSLVASDAIRNLREVTGAHLDGKKNPTEFMVGMHVIGKLLNMSSDLMPFQRVNREHQDLLSGIERKMETSPTKLKTAFDASMRVAPLLGHQDTIANDPVSIALATHKIVKHDFVIGKDGKPKWQVTYTSGGEQTTVEGKPEHLVGDTSALDNGTAQSMRLTAPEIITYNATLDEHNAKVDAYNEGIAEANKGVPLDKQTPPRERREHIPVEHLFDVEHDLSWNSTIIKDPSLRALSEGLVVSQDFSKGRWEITYRDKGDNEAPPADLSHEEAVKWARARPKERVMIGKPEHMVYNAPDLSPQEVLINNREVARGKQTDYGHIEVQHVLEGAYKKPTMKAHLQAVAMAHVDNIVSNWKRGTQARNPSIDPKVKTEPYTITLGLAKVDGAATQGERSLKAMLNQLPKVDLFVDPKEALGNTKKYQDYKKYRMDLTKQFRKVVNEYPELRGLLSDETVMVIDEAIGMIDIRTDTPDAARESVAEFIADRDEFTYAVVELKEVVREFDTENKILLSDGENLRIAPPSFDSNNEMATAYFHAFRTELKKFVDKENATMDVINPDGTLTSQEISYNEIDLNENMFVLNRAAAEARLAQTYLVNSLTDKGSRSNMTDTGARVYQMAQALADSFNGKFTPASATKDNGGPSAQTNTAATHKEVTSAVKEPPKEGNTFIQREARPAEQNYTASDGKESPVNVEISVEGGDFVNANGYVTEGVDGARVLDTDRLFSDTGVDQFITSLSSDYRSDVNVKVTATKDKGLTVHVTSREDLGMYSHPEFKTHTKVDTENNRVLVNLDTIVIPKEAQMGAGKGTELVGKMLQQSIRLAQQQGLLSARVELTADITVGGYVWGASGWQVGSRSGTARANRQAREGVLAIFHEGLADLLKEYGIKDIAPDSQADIETKMVQYTDSFLMTGHQYHLKEAFGDYVGLLDPDKLETKYGDIPAVFANLMAQNQGYEAFMEIPSDPDDITDSVEIFEDRFAKKVAGGENFSIYGGK